jgi:hypothetical protein
VSLCGCGFKPVWMRVQACVGAGFTTCVDAGFTACVDAGFQARMAERSSADFVQPGTPFKPSLA